MAMGAISYDWITSGSTATSAAGQRDFFGVYNGLSLLNQDDVVIVQIQASVNDLRVGPKTLTNNTGIPIGAYASLIDLPPMRVGLASGLQIAREGSADASMAWVAWRQLPYSQK